MLYLYSEIFVVILIILCSIIKPGEKNNMPALLVSVYSFFQRETTVIVLRDSGNTTVSILRLIIKLKNRRFTLFTTVSKVLTY